jgi:hypothetical protein
MGAPLFVTICPEVAAFGRGRLSELPAKLRLTNEETSMSKTTMSMTQPAAPVFSKASMVWTNNREATLNWLAFGLLLAAWNAAGDDSSNPRARPEALRGYSSVSVRAAQRSITQVP